VSLVRRLVAADEAAETRVFLFMAAFGLAVAAVYWFVSYEPAGTVLLGVFGVATGLVAARLAADPASRRLRNVASTRAEAVAPGLGNGGESGRRATEDDRPFSDESGRIPDESLAPFAVGLGLAVAATGLVFGAAPLVVGLLPLSWGAWTWLTAAGEELAATRLDEVDR
jgi:hypothetical protein